MFPKHPAACKLRKHERGVGIHERAINPDLVTMYKVLHESVKAAYFDINRMHLHIFGGF